MTLHNRPGITLTPVAPPRRVQGLARGDVPVLIGATTRGPVMEPVRIESLRQYETIFGVPVDGGHLTDAVKGFFESGGRTAYVLRVAGPAARVAGATVSPHWQVRARTPLAALGAVGDTVQSVADVLPWFDHLRRTYGLSLPDPGAWANDLGLSLNQVVRVRAEAKVAGPATLQPRSMAGITLHGLLRLPGGIARVLRLDTARGDVQVAGVPDLVTGTSLMIEVVTFDAEVLVRGQRVEAFADLHPVPEHPGSIAARLNRQSAYLELVFTGTDPDFTDETQWPALGRFGLSGGTADLSGLTEGTWTDAVTAQARVDEIALVAIPDLVRQPSPPRTDLQPARAPDPVCDLPVARPNAAIAGQVVDGATGLAIAGCQVLAAGAGGFAITDAQGYFFIDALAPGLIDLRLSAAGFEDAETFLQSLAAAQKFWPRPDPLPVGDPAFARMPLISRDAVKTFDADTVALIQRAAPALMGDYRIFVCDPPAPGLGPEMLLEWQSQLGQDARLFAVAPWLAVEGPKDGLLALPPSGHVCGAFARAELAQGVHCAPANLPLRHAKQLTTDFDEPTLAAFHLAGLNPLRAVPGQGLRLMGSRTLSTEADWQQVSVRRLFDAIEKTLAGRLAWSVFEPNSITTRAILRFSVEQFLENLRRRGMFAGDTSEQAYGVACDGGNNTPDGAARGELFIDIGIAPTKPYEFIRFSLTAQADAIAVTEAT